VTNFLIVALGGGIGAAARYGVNVSSGKILGSDFPWHTLIANIVGCFAMGILTEAMALKLNVSNEMRLFLTTGILGGFTTFSAFALDFALMAARREFLSAGGYVLASVFLSIIGCFLGLAFVRSVLA
jgi:fluoride exporter